jgi:hypothetical protein
MFEETLFEDLNNPIFWFIAIIGLYLWAFWLCVISGVRQASMEQFDLILVHKNRLICRCKQQSPPSYEQLYGKLPSYQEALLLV